MTDDFKTCVSPACSACQEVRRLRAENDHLRKSVARAWSAFLDTLTQEMWDDIRAAAPDTWARFRKALLGAP